MLPEQVRQQVGGHAPALVDHRDRHVHAVVRRGDRDRGRLGGVPRRVGETGCRGTWTMRCRSAITRGRSSGEPDVRIPAEPEVATLALDGQPLHPVAAAAAGLNEQEECPAVAVTSWPQGRDLLGSVSSCHRDRLRESAPRICHVQPGTGGPTTERLARRIARESQKHSDKPESLGVPQTTSEHYWVSGSANTKRLLAAPGRISGVRTVNPEAVPALPVLTATYWRPSTA